MTASTLMDITPDQATAALTEQRAKLAGLHRDLDQVETALADAEIEPLLGGHVDVKQVELLVARQREIQAAVERQSGIVRRIEERLVGWREDEAAERYRTYVEASREASEQAPSAEERYHAAVIELAHAAQALHGLANAYERQNMPMFSYENAHGIRRPRRRRAPEPRLIGGAA